MKSFVLQACALHCLRQMSSGTPDGFLFFIFHQQTQVIPPIYLPFSLINKSQATEPPPPLQSNSFTNMLTEEPLPLLCGANLPPPLHWDNFSMAVVVAVVVAGWVWASLCTARAHSHVCAYESDSIIVRRACCHITSHLWVCDGGMEGDRESRRERDWDTGRERTIERENKREGDTKRERGRG